ncbi:hypothetical protein LPJ78_000337 [Coemansia sp. RSA 989]|nr:hypothetical protein LPJ78_000337 [Coemansia sp. RSA 989]
MDTSDSYSQQQSANSALAEFDDLNPGNFPFPLTDQASLFNFHTSSGLGIGPFGMGNGQDMFAGFDASAGGANDDLAVDMDFLDRIARNEPLSASLPFGQSGTPAQTSTAIDASSDVSGQPLLQSATGDASARMRAARAHALNTILNSMSFGGIQQVDGFYNGNMAVPPSTSMDNTAVGLLGASGLNPMVSPGSFGLGPTYPSAAVPFPPITPLSPTSPYASSSQPIPTAAATAPAPAKAGPESTSSQQGSGQPRIDHACKMCRRRKVRCDGKRPSCKFCTTKNFECVYEPASSSGRKRGRKPKNAAASSNVGSARSESVYSDETDRLGKQRRFSGRMDTVLDGIGESPEESDADSTTMSSGEAGARHEDLAALSNRQIALPDAVHAEMNIQSISDDRAEEATDKAKDSRSTTSLAAQHMQLYFANFHPQHPILHRHTFEKTVRDGTVSRVLWHSVQAIAARYGPAPATEPAAKENAMEVDGAEKQLRPALRPYEYGKRYAALARALLPEATRAPTIEAIQALYLLSEHQFGMGDWLEGSSYWGTAVRMFNQFQLHMTDEAFQFPAYTSHLGLHESAISPLTCRQSPANYAAEMRKPTLNNYTWIRREMVRRMRWALFESERAHSLATGNPPLVTLEAGWVHMPCSDEIWDMPSPRRAAEYERLLLHMGRYYVDTGGSLRIDIAPDTSAPPSKPPSISGSPEDGSDISDEAQRKPQQTGSDVSGETRRRAQQQQQQQHATPAPNRVASMLVSVRRRKNRIHLNAHTAIVIGQMTRARLALFRLFFPCRWPSQLMSADLFGASHDSHDLGGGGGAPGPVVLSWDERFRRMRATIADIEGKLMQWRVYLESMFPLREHEEGSGRNDDENRAIHRERVEYANYRFMLAALLIQNRSTVLQLQACLTRRECKIKTADQEPNMDETAKQTLANHILPNQPGEQAMRSLRGYGQECWDVIVRQACEIEDLLESHWQVRPHANPSLHVMIKPDWHSQNAIKAKLNADTNLRLFPHDAKTNERNVDESVKVFFSHETPPYPLLVVNQRLLAAVINSANDTQTHYGTELALASSMNSNIHIETNANARNLQQGGLGVGSRLEGRKARVSSMGSNGSRGSSSSRRKGASAPLRPRFSTKDSGEVDFESGDETEADALMDPFRMQFVGTSYYLFLAAKALIMYIHHAKMSAHILARRKPAALSNDGSDDILPSSSVSVSNDNAAEHAQDMMLLPDFVEDLSPPPQLRTLADIRRMQDRLEVVLAALRTSQKYWMSVDYFVLCARKLRNMAEYGPWRTEDPVSTDISAELANEMWPPHF